MFENIANSLEIAWTEEKKKKTISPTDYLIMEKIY